MCGLESALIAVLSVPQTVKELAGAENNLELLALLLPLRCAGMHTCMLPLWFMAC